MSDPIPFNPDLEQVPADEAETIRGLNDAMQDILERVAEDEGHAYRSVHAKSHGMVAARLTIAEDLPQEYRQGIFARPGEHEAILRVSTNPGDVLHDSVSVPRGMALKVLNVEGDRLEGSEDDKSQDFVMVNGPAFAAPDAAEFLKTLKFLAKTTDRAEWGKKLVSKILQGVDKGLTATTGPSATVRTLGGAPNTHPLGETYYSQTPFRFGDYMAKFQFAPVSNDLAQLTGQTIDTSKRPDALREAVDASMRQSRVRWELRVQLCRDLDVHPIEDATVVWDEEVSPFVTIASVEAAAQPGWTQPRAEQVDDHMRFSPWIGLEAHRPLGSINRARKSSYEHSAEFREKYNSCPIHDPRSAELPS